MDNPFDHPLISPSYSGGLAGGGPPIFHTPSIQPLTVPPPPPEYRLVTAFFNAVDALPPKDGALVRFILFAIAYPHVLAARGNASEWDPANPAPLYQSSKVIKRLVVKTIHLGGAFEVFVIHSLANGLPMAVDWSAGSIIRRYMEPFTEWSYVSQTWREQ